jgi:hypothetical protein
VNSKASTTLDTPDAQIGRHTRESMRESMLACKSPISHQRFLSGIYSLCSAQEHVVFMEFLAYFFQAKSEPIINVSTVFFIEA